ncbi:hypothetical protein HHL19_29360 [Streptomyces sp. R302]|uniref:hypothetical protein n=1 Tax=unclassified Streptomyces TaxID=2593676 RepID=UPI00145C3A55|nr:MULTISPECIES: hypothetical protein [unclassified Streptomyces]NML55238.1 hypothetical protein [Streptomyces sp. R301]NML82658.1 hypothetical protein [Streptomyces sp. R302]
MGWTLTHEGSAFVNFRHFDFAEPRPHAHAFRWLDVKHFALPGRAASATDRDLLAALIAHEQFRDDYAGGGVDPEGTRHGEYWLRCVTPEAYEPIGRDRATLLLRTWADQHGPLPAPLSEALRSEAYDALAAADAVHHLDGLGEAEYHDWASVHGEFHELVLINHGTGRLTLLVAADD